MRFRLVVLGFLLVSAAPASAADPIDLYCRDIGAPRGSADYRECRSLFAQMRSDDPYFAAGARARLSYLAQHLANRRRAAEEAPDFSIYGTPAPSESHGCVMLGDGMGGGIADCN